MKILEKVLNSLELIIDNNTSAEDFYELKDLPVLPSLMIINDLNKVVEFAENCEKKLEYKKAVIAFLYLLSTTKNNVFKLRIIDNLYHAGYEKYSYMLLDNLHDESTQHYHYLEFQLRRNLKEDNLNKIIYYTEECIKKDLNYQLTEYLSDIVFSRFSKEQANNIYQSYWRKLPLDNKIHIKALFYFSHYRKAKIFLLCNLKKCHHNIEWMRSYVIVLAALGEKKKAMDFARSCQFNNLIDHYNFIGFAAEKCGNINLALEFYMCSFQEGYSYDSSINVARKYINEFRLQEAESIIYKVLQDKNNYMPVTLFFMAKIIFLQGNPNKCIEFLDQSLIELQKENVKNLSFENIVKYFRITCLPYANRLKEAYYAAADYIQNYKVYSTIDNEIFLVQKIVLMVFFGLRLKVSFRSQEHLPRFIINDVDIEKSIKNSNDIVKDIKKHVDRWSFIVNFQTGDAYLFLMLLKRFRDKIGDCNVAVYYPARLKYVCYLFESQIDSFYEIPNEIDNWTFLNEFTCFQPGIPLLAHPLFLSNYKNGLMRVNMDYKDHLMATEDSLGLSSCFVERVFHPPVKTVNNNLNSSLKEGVLLVPLSNSFKLLDKIFWDCLSKKLLDKGYVVYENIGPEGGIGIHGVIPLVVNHEELLSACCVIRKVIGLRSGFFDIISGLSIDLDIIYPVFSQSDFWATSWQIKSFSNAKNLNEHFILLEDIDCVNYTKLINDILVDK